MSGTHLPDQQFVGEDWAGTMGDRWLSNLSGFEGSIAPIGRALIDHAGYTGEERVLDLGCGGGATTLEIAKTVGAEGRAIGLDISPALVDFANQRAVDAGLSNAHFICADAATARLSEAPFDRLFSRFGSMFFAEPVPAFANLRAMLKPGARIDLAVWASPADNPWMAGAIGILRNHVDMPPPEPRAPGPFAFEDTEYLTDVLARAGYSDVRIVPHLCQLPVGGPGKTPEEAKDFVTNGMSAGELLKDQPAAVRDAALGEILALFAAHHVPGDGVMMGAKVWLVSASA